MSSKDREPTPFELNEIDPTLILPELTTTDESDEASILDQSIESEVQHSTKNVFIVLDETLEALSALQFVRACVVGGQRIVCWFCMYVRRVAVNARSLLEHLRTQHEYQGICVTNCEVYNGNDIRQKLDDIFENMKDLPQFYMNKTHGPPITADNASRSDFSCFQCGVDYYDFSILKAHMNHQHNAKRFQCGLCKVESPSPSIILNHLCLAKETELSALKYRCFKCDITLLHSEVELIEHLQRVHFTCHFCLFSVKLSDRPRERILGHVFNHFGFFICRHCNFRLFKKSHVYYMHMLTKHDDCVRNT